jgi:hypothetical protein
MTARAKRKAHGGSALASLFPSCGRPGCVAAALPAGAAMGRRSPGGRPVASWRRARPEDGGRRGVGDGTRQSTATESATGTGGLGREGQLLTGKSFRHTLFFDTLYFSTHSKLTSWCGCRAGGPGTSRPRRGACAPAHATLAGAYGPGPGRRRREGIARRRAGGWRVVGGRTDIYPGRWGGRDLGGSHPPYFPLKILG